MAEAKPSNEGVTNDETSITVGKHLLDISFDHSENEFKVLYYVGIMSQKQSIFKCNNAQK